MKKKIFGASLTVLTAILILAMLIVIPSAEKKLVADGYCVKKDGDAAVATNVKWEIFEENGKQTIYFSIDASKGDKNTILYSKNKATGADINIYNANDSKNLPWGEYLSGDTSKLTKAVIGDGITEISGAMFTFSKVDTIEFPKTLVKLGNNIFARMSRLKAIYVNGNEVKNGVADLSKVTSLGASLFANNAATDGAIKEYILNPQLKGKLSNLIFSRNGSLQKITIPAGVTAIGDQFFNECSYVAFVYFDLKADDAANKDDIALLTENTFKGIKKYPRLVGYKGTEVETFAKENGYTFIDRETGKVVHEGTKPLAEENPFIPEFEEPDLTGATASGKLYKEGGISDATWIYYKDTKTLKIVSNSTKAGETGTGAKGYYVDGKGWSDYLTEIENVVIGDYITTLSTQVFKGMTALKTVELSRSTVKINYGAFEKCSSLTTVYIRGIGKAENGVADFTGVTVNDTLFLKDSAVKTLKLDGKNSDPAAIKGLPKTLTKIITTEFNDAFDAFCKEKKYDLQDANDPNNVKLYYVEPQPETTVPKDTTTAPKDTTTAPKDTTTAPKDTTTAPKDTTTAPKDTTTAPSDTTIAPKDTTVAPKDTTVAPKDTTDKPKDTTDKPKDTTGKPVSSDDTDDTTPAQTDDVGGKPSDDKENGSTVLWIVIIVVVVLAAASCAVIFIIMAKKNMKKNK